MNPVIKAQANQFQQNNPIEGFSAHEYFEAYAIYSILNGQLNFNSDPFEAHLRGCEFGLDGLAISIQGTTVTDADQASAIIEQARDSAVEFLFFQVKSGVKYDYGDISKFIDAVRGFFDSEMDNESDQLDEYIKTKDAVYAKPLRRNPKLSCYFITSGTYEPAKRTEVLISKSKQAFADSNLFSDVQVRLLGAKDLQQGYRAATSANSAEVEFPKCQTLPTHPKVEQAYIGYLKAEQLLKLSVETFEDAERLNPTVFFDNVRDFDPTSKINKGIIKELKKGDPAGFVFRNNGVTVIAKNIRRTGDKFTLTDFQIVNGCQTTNILFQCQDVINNVAIPFRLIESRSEEFVTSIILGTNTQNAVRDEQFWALRPFMKDLEEFSKQQPGDGKLFIERRENQYRTEVVERTRIVKPTELMKAVAAMYLFQPHRAARDFRGIRSDYDEEIFLPGHNVSLYHLAGYASYRFEFFIRNNRLHRKTRIFKYYILAGLGYEHCQGKGAFKFKQAEQQAFCDNVRKILASERDFLKYCNRISSIMDSLVVARLDNSPKQSRERVRDALRSDSLSKEFFAILKV